MPKLLIVPANGAIRYNPQNPTGFPDLHHQELVSGAQAALDFYAQEEYTIVVCENAGAVEKGIVTLKEKLAEMIMLMTRIAPQIDHLVFCTDYTGAFAYLLSKQDKFSFPELRRLRSKHVANYDRLKAPDDEAGCWESIDVAPFRKPNPGMIAMLMSQIQPTHTVYVWERQEDKDAFTSLDYNPIGSVVCQSASLWRQSRDPQITDTPPRSPQKSKTQAQAVDLRTTVRRFEYVNPSQNANKFWEIWMSLDHKRVMLNYGRIGTNGRSSPLVKNHTDAVSAIQDYEKRITAQLKDGYTEVF
jgi:predicted DNA-binding WGR domain protein